jgi:hypothetical protein
MRGLTLVGEAVVVFLRSGSAGLPRPPQPAGSPGEARDVTGSDTTGRSAKRSTLASTDLHVTAGPRWSRR